jgi:hypothetical protein
MIAMTTSNSTSVKPADRPPPPVIAAFCERFMSTPPKTEVKKKDRAGYKPASLKYFI